MADLKKPFVSIESEEEKEDTGTGGDSTDTGTGTAAQFKDFLSSQFEIRDDLLPEEIKKKIFAKHKDISELNIKRQRDKREHYKAIKEGKINAQAFANGFQNQEGVKPHLLAQTVQFGSGVIETQVNAIPGEINEANQEKAIQLRYQYEQRYTPQASPSFTPKPYPW